MGENRDTALADERSICDALRLALVATELRLAWHAGAISAEQAMGALDQAFCDIRLSDREARSL